MPARAPSLSVRLRRALGAGVSSCALLGAAAAAAPSADARDVHVDPGPLATALGQLAAQTGVLLAADARLTAGRSSPGLDGRYTPRAALEALLRDTGLALVALADGYGLQVAPPRPSPKAPLDAASTPVSPTQVVEIRGTAEARYRTLETEAATRVPTRLQALPQSVAVVSRALIDDLALGSVAEAERFVPGVGVAQGEGNRDTPVYRGDSTTADFLVDGMRDDAPYLRDLYAVDRVEALTGPNAMLLGAGAAGGVINRVTKAPTGAPGGELRLQAGAWGQRRATIDWEPPGTGDELGLRLNGLVEASGGYRDFFWLRRRGLLPVVAWRSGATRASVAFELFEDERLADRGIPSDAGRPLATSPSTFFGAPAHNVSRAALRSVAVRVDRPLGETATLHHQTRFTDLDKFFRNAFPAGAVSDDGGTPVVALSAYDRSARRRDVDSRTELEWPLVGAGPAQRLLAGVELGASRDDFGRETGFFGPGDVPIVEVPVAAPAWTGPLTFRRLPTDADGTARATAVGLYVQDQVQFTPRWSAVAGLRHDHLDVRMDDRRPVATAATLHGRDAPWSPRLGVVFTPVPAVSLYANYAVGHVPRAGDQLASLTPGNAALSPERFTSLELGAKWAVTAGLDATAALYTLRRHGAAVTSADPGASEVTLVDGERSRGLELGLNGALASGWQATVSYALQDSRLRAALSPAAPAGASLPHVPRHSLSAWTRVTLDARWAAGVGVLARSAMFASTDNLVRLPGYARLDAGVFYRPAPAWLLQLNVENLLDRRYAAFAQGDNNITPGAPRGWRLALTAGF